MNKLKDLFRRLREASAASRMSTDESQNKSRDYWLGAAEAYEKAAFFLDEILSEQPKKKSRGWRVLADKKIVQKGDIFSYLNYKREPIINPWFYGKSVSYFKQICCLNAIVERRLSKSQWHRVEDDLPIKGQLVLGYFEGIECQRMIFLATSDGTFSYPDGGDVVAVVTHWRELPKFNPERDA
jgi:hypothetical protein